MNYFKTKKMIKNIEDVELWKNLTFKSICYHRNFDLTIPNENIITEYDGNILKVRIKEKKLPVTVGEFSYSTWNLRLGRNLKFKIKKLFEIYSDEIQYEAFVEQLKNKNIKLKEYDKLVFIDRIVLHDRFRKHDICDEFMEFIYRNYYDSKTLIVTYIKPVQEDLVDEEFYLNYKQIQVKENIKSILPVKNVLARDYYKLDEFMINYDKEISTYKLFALATKCGFERVNESKIFIYNTNHTIKRLKYKFN